MLASFEMGSWMNRMCRIDPTVHVAKKQVKAPKAGPVLEYSVLITYSFTIT